MAILPFHINEIMQGEPWENWVCRERKIIRLRKE